MAAVIDSLTIKPDRERLAVLLQPQPAQTIFNQPLHTWRESTRRELSLPVDRPIIATGHQAEFWHPGILAKYILADALAKQVGGVAVQVVVDQDVTDFSLLDMPVRDAEQRLESRTLDLLPHRTAAPTGKQSAFDPAKVGRNLQPALPSVDEGLKAIVESLQMHRDARTAAEQIGLALGELMAAWANRPAIVMAGTLLETSFGRKLLAKLSDDPQTCAEAYNRAIVAAPGAATPLLIRDDRIEVPLWRIEPNGVRIRAYDDDLDRFRNEPTRLMPRALLMTAILRLVVCDLFIHGTGGERYDRAMEKWIKDWLHVEPAPMAGATATVRLPIGPSWRERIDPATAITNYRQAWHDPESFEADQSPGPVKKELLREIHTLPRNSVEKRSGFVAMHKKLAQLREQHAVMIEKAQRQLMLARVQAKERAIAERRTWAFPLYPQEILNQLRERIVSAVAGDERVKG